MVAGVSEPMLLIEGSPLGAFWQLAPAASRTEAAVDPFPQRKVQECYQKWLKHRMRVTVGKICGVYSLVEGSDDELPAGTSRSSRRVA